MIFSRYGVRGASTGEEKGESGEGGDSR